MKYTLSILSFLYCIISDAKPILIPKTIDDNVSLHSHVSIREVTPDKANIDAIRSMNIEDYFMDYNDYQFLDHHHDYWLTFELKNTSEIRSNYILYLGYAIKLDLYVIYPDSVMHLTGGIINQKHNLVNDINNEFELNLPFNKEIRVYALLHKPGLDHARTLDVRLAQKNSFFKILYEKKFYDGLFLGVLFIMVLYNFFIYLFRKKVVYLYYSLYMLFLGINFMGYRSIFDDYLNTYLYPQQATFLGAIAYIFYMLFVRFYSSMHKQNH